MRRLSVPNRISLLALVTLLQAVPIAACPVCNTETGQQVRAGIFGENFTKNLLSIAAPIPLLLLSALAIPNWLAKDKS